MTIWLLALVLTAIACATLYYASARPVVNAGALAEDATDRHFRDRLRAIDGDLSLGRLSPLEASSAKAELAREVVVHKRRHVGARATRFPVWAPIALVSVLALATYGYLGRPDLPGAPSAAQSGANAELDLEAAVATIEKRLTEAPNDLRGWQVIGPAYMQLSRFADAARAFRRINELQTPTADTLSDLGEALMMQAGGSLEGQPLALFRQAASMDAKHVRSRYYIAGEETRAGDFAAAIGHWNELLALAEGDEPWVVTARNGVAYAEAGLAGSTAPSDELQIDAMVDGLESRLMQQGGSVEEWTQLVRSRMVQGRMGDAQSAYDAARRALPAAADRLELDVLAADNGLVAK